MKILMFLLTSMYTYVNAVDILFSFDGRLTLGDESFRVAGSAYFI